MPRPKTLHDYQELSDRLERAYSDRLALRRVSLADAWPLYEAAKNPLFNKFLMWETPADEHDVLARLDTIVEATRRGRLAAVSGVVRTTGEWASLFRFQPWSGDPSVMEMGVWTHDRFWAGRYTLELSKMCIDACFASSDVDRLVGAASPDNAGSCQLMRSVGMADTELVARRTEDGRVVQLQEFEILRSTWDSRAAARVQAPSHQVVPSASGAVAARREAAEAMRRAREPDDSDATDRKVDVAD